VCAFRNINFITRQKQKVLQKSPSVIVNSLCIFGGVFYNHADLCTASSRGVGEMKKNKESFCDDVK